MPSSHGPRPLLGRRNRRTTRLSATRRLCRSRSCQGSRSRCWTLCRITIIDPPCRCSGSRRSSSWWAFPASDTSGPRTRQTLAVTWLPALRRRTRGTNFRSDPARHRKIRVVLKPMAMTRSRVPNPSQRPTYLSRTRLSNPPRKKVLNRAKLRRARIHRSSRRPIPILRTIIRRPPSCLRVRHRKKSRSLKTPGTSLRGMA